MKKLISCFIIILSLLCAGCLSVKYTERTQYMLDSSLPKTQKKPSNNILEIMTPSIATQFSGNSFVYRVNKNRYLTDYYHVFFTPPAFQIHQLTINYVSHLGLFHAVTSGNNFLLANYILQSEILALYADYCDRQKPRGVIKISFILLHYDENHQLRILFQKTYSSNILLQKKDSQSLINAWGQGLTHILSQLSLDLKRTISHQKAKS